MEGFSGFWSLTIVLGPIILLILIAFAVIRRRRLTPAERVSQKDATEAGYREPEKMR